MATLSGFMDHVYTQMYSRLNAVEQKRLFILGRLKKATVVLCGVVGFGTFGMIHAEYMAPLPAGIGALLLVLVGLGMMYRHEIAGFQSLFKETVIEEIVRFIDPLIVYKSQQMMAPALFDKSHLWPARYDRYHGSDYMEGRIEGVFFQCSVLHVEEKRTNHKRQEEWHTLFKGLFFVADFPKAFHAKTYIFPDNAERFLGTAGTWLQELNRTHGRLIKMDHGDFEKAFVVYGEDPVETHYVLSHTLMERILLLHDRHKGALSIALLEGKLYMGLAYSQPMFEPILFRSVLNFETMRGYFEMLQEIFAIITTLKLDQKLWSKR